MAFVCAFRRAETISSVCSPYNKDEFGKNLIDGTTFLVLLPANFPSALREQMTTSK